MSNVNSKLIRKINESNLDEVIKDFLKEGLFIEYSIDIGTLTEKKALTKYNTVIGNYANKRRRNK